MKELNPIVGIVLVVIALAAVGFFMWRASSPPTYSGPPIDMGKMMGGQNAPKLQNAGQNAPQRPATR